MSAIRERIVELYGTKILRKSALNIRCGAGVFERVMAGQVHTALEIGTYRGVAAAEMAQYCAHVVTIDLEYGKIEQNGETFDRKEFWKSLGVQNITFIPVRGDAHKKTVVDALAFDFAFIDGGHGAKSVRTDFDLVKRCGRVLFHDADDNRLRDHKPHASNDVYEFVATLPREQVQFIDIFALWTAPGRA